jgi:hypothetical protein
MQQPLQEVQNRPQQQLHPNQQLHKAVHRSSSSPMQQASTQELLQVFDLSDFLALADGQAPSGALLQQCQQLAECLVKTGCLVVSIWALLLLLLLLLLIDFWRNHCFHQQVAANCKVIRTKEYPLCCQAGQQDTTC